MKFEDLKFEKRTDEDIFSAIGMSHGSARAKYDFNNGYSLSVLKGSYLCGKDTYEVGVLKDERLCSISKNSKPLFEKLCTIAKDDDSGQFVFGFVTKSGIEEMAKILEEIK